MGALTFGYVLLAIVVIAFLAGFYNFQSKTRLQLAQYELDKADLTEQLKRQQREREKEQAVITTQNWTMTEAEERIRVLEAKVNQLEQLADRVEALGDRYTGLLGPDG